MLENQFIKFYTSIQDASTEPVFPIYMKQASTPLSIFAKSLIQDGLFSAIEIVRQNDTFIAGEQYQFGNEDIYFTMFATGEFLANAYTYLENGQIFHIRLRLEDDREDEYYMYSQPCVCIKEGEEYSKIKYKCDEDAFGFPFHTLGDHFAQLCLPIRLHSPQNEQDDKTYVKANGEVVTLFAKYYKEWEGETEYLSEAMHDKIVAALSCDEVYINGKRVTKSDKYQVDWENYDLDCDGVTKLARATFKVRENTNQRNSNF